MKKWWFCFLKPILYNWKLLQKLTRCKFSKCFFVRNRMQKAATPYLLIWARYLNFSKNTFIENFQIYYFYPALTSWNIYWLWNHIFNYRKINQSDIDLIDLIRHDFFSTLNHFKISTNHRTRPKYTNHILAVFKIVWIPGTSRSRILRDKNRTWFRQAKRNQLRKLNNLKLE